MRTRHIIGKTIAWPEFDVTAVLFEIGNAVGLEQYLDEGMLG